jgi:Zn-dependent protease
MKNSITIGRLAGVSIELNWTVLVIAALVTFTLAGGILPAAAPGLDSGTYIAGGLIAAIGLLASILVHELGHAIVARRNNVDVERISLWAFGGVAQLKGEAATPKAEFKIAGVGPAISLVVGGILLVPAAFLTGIGAAVVGWLGAINIVLGVFNLIPGAPLDGGRLLRAWIWHRHGDRVRAIKTASKAGRILGTGLFGLGLVQFLLGGAGGGLWTAFIGWFVRGAATEEGRYGALQSDLATVRIRDIMTPAGPAMGDWLSVEAFIDLHASEARRPFYLLAGADGTTTALLSLRHLAAVPPAERSTTSVRTVARPIAELPTVQAGASAADLLGVLGSAQLAVVSDGSVPVGTVTNRQMSRAGETAQLVLSLRGEQRTAA